jgi:phosphoglycolate phosphatase-like HAD superfamily hydrolase
MVRVVVCDFDGVVVDSNRLKHEAFVRLFPAEMRPVVDGVLAEAREQSRIEIIGRILTGARGRADPETVASLAEDYDREVTASIRAIGVRPGVRETLADLTQRYQVYLNSTTPEASLRRTVTALGLAGFFRDVRGGPASKLDNLSSIMVTAQAAGADVVVVGDGESDLASARARGCVFVGIPNEFNGWVTADFPLIADLTALRGVLSHLRP